MRETDWKKYILVFLITGAIFGTALYVSNLFNSKRFEEIRTIEDKIAIDILSSETQFSLLAESSCKEINNSVLSREINSLAEKLSYTEEKLGNNNDEVIKLKRYYSLLQIKDYLLMKRIISKCGIKPVVILYFYSNEGDCTLCEKAGYVLTYLREQYPDLRVYAFDYNLDLSALKTMISIFKIERQLPVIVVNDVSHYGLENLEDFEKVIPELKSLRQATSTTATTTSR